MGRRRRWKARATVAVQPEEEAVGRWMLLTRGGPVPPRRHSASLEGAGHDAPPVDRGWRGRWASAWSA
jgi:hypothetical protein